MQSLSEKDFIETLKKCEKISVETYRKFNWFQRLSGHILRLVAPLF
jgi:cardiolipin synthase